MTTVATVGGIVSMIAVAGGAVFYIASLEGRISDLEAKVPTSNIEAISTAKEAALAAVVTEQASALSELQQLSTTQMTEISRLADEKQDQIRQLIFADGSVTIGGVCFRPRMITRCFGGSNHMTWVDNADECTQAGYRVEGQVPVLAQC